MGLSADTGSLAWVHTQGADVLGGAAAAGALVVCDAEGNVTVLDAKAGAVTQTFDLGGPVKSCAVQADGFREPSPRGPAPTLASQIEAAIADRDLELAIAQKLLLRELGTLDDEGVTHALITIASDPRTSPVLVADARAELATRRTGLSFMRDALARHYDYLKDELRPPPVGPIADALAAAKDASAAPLLVAHLFDPADSDDDLRRAALALSVLAGPNEVPDLARFLAMYRAAPDDPESVRSAVVSVGQALLSAGGAAGRAAVDRAIASGLTNPVVKEKLIALERAAFAGEGAAAPAAPAPAAPRAGPSGR
jgi:outer membrane protein assembly factor BamB